MKRYIQESVYVNGISEESSTGVFWVIEDELFAYPFGTVDTYNGMAKSGATYNHKRLWADVKPKGCNKPYNYYPRGRVELSNKGKPIIYMNPNIDVSLIDDIKAKFGLRENPVIRYDYSVHYRCYLDDGFEPEK